jgi:ribonuclease E
MSKLMLIDAAHAEETRVVVTDGSRVEEFDFESQARKQLRGNIYLAKVSRVEPSLQAAFIEYGGNRHGFLAFSEIHPDYYQIPLADREALLREEAEDDGEDDSAADEAEAAEADGDADADADEDIAVEQAARRRRRLMRRYKIQDVIKRRQVMLVQVVKEERGNKGAALTTYLSLAGRYGVLMPNTARGGGISRKITSATDRKRLKSVVQGLKVPDGMGLIIRTAGAKRTKTEIQRDYEYLMRAWDEIREKTMESIAPSLIYAEEDLVKRAIRDMYDKDMDGIVVEGDKGYRDARDFMRMLIPSHAKKITQHADPIPLFVKYKIEEHLSQIYSPVVPLKSGGYLVINQTEALVAVDVNSGRSTRERNIEATALKTNLEAADEACRQLRLRDLAGLIVIDFIDMEEAKNNRAVEKRLKDGLAHDRARVQMGKISPFGLMEISRQRRRTGVLEGTTHVCEHCGGSGRVRTAESSALSALRAIELEAVRGGAGDAILKVAREVALYILNEKRAYLQRLSDAHGLFITVLVDDEVGRSEHVIERTGHSAEAVQARRAPPLAVQRSAEEEADELIEDDTEEEDEVDISPDKSDGSEVSEDDDSRRRPRHRARGGRDQRDQREERDEQQEEQDDSHGARRRRRRGRRGGRRVREEATTNAPYGWARMRAPDGDPYVWLDPATVLDGGREDREQARTEAAPRAPASASAAGGDDIWVELPAKEDKPSRSRSRRRRRGEKSADKPIPETADAATPVETAAPVSVEPAPSESPPTAETIGEPASEKPEKRSRTRKPKTPVKTAESKEPESVSPVVAAEDEAPPPETRPETETKKSAKPEPKAEGPDPAEIKAPPAKPKSGWWRKSG